MVYVATKDIPAGGVIDQNSVSKTAISTSIDTSLYITDDDLGKIAVVNISQGQSVFQTWLEQTMLLTYENVNMHLSL